MVEKEFIYFGQISIFLSLKYILLYFYVYIKKGSNGKIKVLKYRTNYSLGMLSVDLHLTFIM